MEVSNDTLENKGIFLTGGTMVDATIINAPTRPKNKNRTRDPQMHSTRKGNQWYFGVKVHVGADVNSGLAHTVSVTPANALDSSQLPDLIREDDKAVFGDKGYVDNRLKRVARKAYWGVLLKATKKRRLTSSEQTKEPLSFLYTKSREHIFRIIKQQFGYGAQ